MLDGPAMCTVCSSRSLRVQESSRQPMQTIVSNWIRPLDDRFFRCKPREERAIERERERWRDGCFFDSEVGEGFWFALRAMIRRTHTHIHTRIYERPFYLSGCVPQGLVHRWSQIPSLVTRLMVNGSTGNPLKTSHGKALGPIDCRENCSASRLLSDQLPIREIHAGFSWDYSDGKRVWLEPIMAWGNFGNCLVLLS